jgi:hypothetical protein
MLYSYYCTVAPKSQNPKSDNSKINKYCFGNVTLFDTVSCSRFVEALNAQFVGHLLLD